ncbi:MAG: hypothetical protein IT539_17425 [Bradyrhizobiaceae bacterium]|nr:hypothetical protein [Bradyrhizobiaceae bacterium]
MRISASLSTGVGLHRRDTAAGEAHEAANAAKPSLPAVVPVPHDRRATASVHRVRPAAALIAQLVAGAENLPVARTRRRADPQSTAKLYRTMSELPAAARRRAGQDL